MELSSPYGTFKGLGPPRWTLGEVLRAILRARPSLLAMLDLILLAQNAP